MIIHIYIQLYNLRSNDQISPKVLFKIGGTNNQNLVYSCFTNINAKNVAFCPCLFSGSLGRPKEHTIHGFPILMCLATGNKLTSTGKCSPFLFLGNQKRTASLLLSYTLIIQHCYGNLPLIDAL